MVVYTFRDLYQFEWPKTSLRKYKEVPPESRSRVWRVEEEDEKGMVKFYNYVPFLVRCLHCGHRNVPGQPAQRSPFYGAREVILNHYRGPCRGCGEVWSAVDLPNRPLVKKFLKRGAVLPEDCRINAREKTWAEAL